ncbi:MAG: hypothetical protein CSA89_01375 [Bacteroidales bacterium]|nr:MAG: hypothetical protein CSA89_01375 [Bacteroidales bacterium]
MNIKKWFLRKRHLLLSNSRKGFGIHSPFVFDFLHNVLNETNAYYRYGDIDKLDCGDKEKAQLRLYYRIINYYHCKNILIVGQDIGFIGIFDKETSVCVQTLEAVAKDYDFSSYDFVFFAKNSFDPDYLFSKEDMIVVLSDDAVDRNYWDRLLYCNKNVYIDLFDFALFFVKKNFQQYKFCFE